MSEFICCDTEKNGKKISYCSSIQPKGNSECPQCKQKAKRVLQKTLIHLLKDSSKSNIDSLSGFYYCKTPECSVIYFKEEEVLTQNDLLIVVGLKNGANPSNICYCFGWTKEKIKQEIEQNGKSNALNDILTRMKADGCSCEIKNPSGKCCMADIKRVEKEITLQSQM